MYFKYKFITASRLKTITKNKIPLPAPGCWEGSLVPYKSKNLAIIPYVSNDVELIDVKTNVEGRYLEFIFLNKPLLPLFDCLKSMYYILRSNTQFKYLSNKKIMITNVPQPGWGSSYRSIWL